MSQETDREVLATWSLSDLDMLHAAVGIGAEWQASDRRRELAALTAAPDSEDRQAGRALRGPQSRSAGLGGSE